MAKSVTVSMPVYEIENRASKDDKRLIVQSHWNRHETMVVITIPGGVRYTVSAKDLQDAIRSCTL